MKNPLQKPYPRYYSYFTIRLMTKQCLIWNYAVKVRQRELRAGGNKLSAATFIDIRGINERQTISPTKQE
jgi:hypothetical protein